MKKGILIGLALLLLTGCSVKHEPATASVPVLFDTDMGNDIDDLLAMQMLMNYERDGRVELLGIGLSKANDKAYDFVRRYYSRYGCGTPEFGFMTDGPNADDGNYLPAALAVLGNDSLPDAGCDAVAMYRRVLSESADSSLTIIATGPLTNMARLLESPSDSISLLSGRELVGRKVKLLSLMGGDYRDEATAEWNILQDAASASTVFDSWPTELVASGFEVGDAIRYPHERIEGDFDQKHPLRVAYESFIAMPYDRQCWDLTSVLYAVEPDSIWFGVSERGEISLDSLGRSTFRPDKDGRRRVLSLSCDSLDEVLANRVK